MYLSRLELLPEAAQKPEFWADLGDLYREHQAIWQLFGDTPERTRDFLFRKERGGLESRWFTLSKRKPIDVRGIWKVEPKQFEPRFEAGQHLFFAVRVNPTVAKTREGRSSARHDVVMNEKRRVPGGTGSISESALVEKACTAWFQARSTRNGFDFDPGQVRFDGYRQVGDAKSGGIRLSTVDIEGFLTVKEPERFQRMLFGGLGPAKSFGCGLMLVRPA
ncbi:MAG: type I-E CRISPR-associated protein Cas6/Cse3/CasE [Deltaproteobacteria bacterium]|nr:type I-E CRISPR-associated protein Cas6/Cse3/CasE [Deltaproteobacteria bacterium]